MWSNLWKHKTTFVCDISLTRKNTSRWSRCQVRLMRDNDLCLPFPPVLWRVQNRWLHFAAVCMRWTPLTRAHLLRTPRGLSWRPWDNSRMRISCVRWSASSWRRSAPMWRYISSPPLPLPRKGEVCFCWFSLTAESNRGREECLGFSWNFAFTLNVKSLFWIVVFF